MAGLLDKGIMNEDLKYKPCVFVLIRHGMTKANKEKRYAGRTNYPLLPEGRQELLRRDYSALREVQAVFSSPLLRCLETAEIVFPGHEKRVIQNFIECDFGHFEDRNYIEMANDSEYQAWVDSGGTLPFPGGEDVEKFKDRCAKGMEEVIDICRRENITKAGCAIHGGVIMSIMERLCTTKREYYSWHPENGCGYVLLSDPGSYDLELMSEINF